MFWKKKKQELPKETTEQPEPQKEVETKEAEPNEKAKVFAEMFKDTHIKEIALEKYELMSQKEAYFEPFAWLLKYLDDNPCPSVVSLSSDDEYKELNQKGLQPFLNTSLTKHTKNVLEQGYILFKRIDPNFYLYEGQWVLTALGHDVGKALISRQKKEGKEVKNQQHQDVSKSLMAELLFYSSYSKLPFGVANSIIEAVAKHHEGKESQNNNILLQVLIKAEQQARELERLNFQSKKEEITDETVKLINLIQEGQISYFYDKKSKLFRVKIEEIGEIINIESLQGIDGIKIEEKFVILDLSIVRSQNAQKPS